MSSKIDTAQYCSQKWTKFFSVLDMNVPNKHSSADALDTHF